MIIYQGFGIFGAMIPVGFMVLFQILFDKFLKLYTTNFMAAVVGAIAIYYFDKYLSEKPNKVVIDKETGVEIIIKKSHTLFFIPLKYWVYIWLVIGVYFFMMMIDTV